MGAATGKVAVWLYEAWARAFLGAPEPDGRPSRWLALGRVEAMATEGLWLHCGRIEEWKASGKKTVVWKFTPPKLLVRWEAVITIQDLDGDDKTIGFRAEL